MSIRLNEYLRRHPLFQALPCEEITGLARQVSSTLYKKGEHVFFSGDPGDRLFIVMHGAVKLTHFTDQGEEAVLKLYGKDEVCGAYVILTNRKHSYEGIAAVDTTVISVSANYLLERMKASPAVLDLILSLMSSEMEGVHLEFEQSKLMSTAQRVSCLLIKLSSGEKGNVRTFKFPYEKALAAKRLGIKPETFSRALSSLQPLGVATNGAEVRINDLSGLAGYCCKSCSAMNSGCNSCQGL